MHFLLYVFLLMTLLLALYFNYGNDIRQKSKFEQFSYLSSELVRKQRQLTTSTTHLARMI